MALQHTAARCTAYIYRYVNEAALAYAIYVCWLYMYLLSFEIHLAPVTHIAHFVRTCKLSNKRKCFSFTFSNVNYGPEMEISSAERHATFIYATN